VDRSGQVGSSLESFGWSGGDVMKVSLVAPPWSAASRARPGHNLFFDIPSGGDLAS